MFGIGVTEMIVIGLVILMLFSPRELPGMMKTLARAYGSIRRTAEEFRAQVMEAEELREPIEEIRAAYHGTKTELLSAQELARRELGRARAEAMKAQQKLAEIAREESRREGALKGRVSASESPDTPARAAGASTPAVPATAASTGSGAPVAGSSAPVAASPGPGAPVGAVASTPGAPVGAVASAPGARAPVAGTVASTLTTANTVPGPPDVPTPAPPPPAVPTAAPAPPAVAPTFSPPPSPARAPDRSDAA